jgi:hypothetical protein
LNLQKAFSNPQVQILCSYWITDFSKLRRELVKAGQSRLADFESRPEPTRRFRKPARANSPILKPGQSQLANFESRPEPIYPVFKSFSQIKKIFELNVK